MNQHQPPMIVGDSLRPPFPPPPYLVTATPVTVPPARRIVPAPIRWTAFPDWPGRTGTGSGDRVAAARGLASVRAHTADTDDTDVSPSLAVADMLADVMHAADALGIDFGSTLDLALSTYQQDQRTAVA